MGALAGLTALVSGVLVFLAARALTRPLGRLVSSATAIGTGDLSSRSVDVDGRGELVALARALDDMLHGLRAMLTEVRKSATKLDAETIEILAGVQQQSASAIRQATAVGAAAEVVKVISAATREAASRADQVIHMTRRSEDLSQEGRAAVEQAVRASQALGDQVTRIAATMTDLTERTQQVGEIVTSVKELAEQSNLLALNASIEASKAGEHGRGFAAVAMEMRNLAEQSRQAAVQVRSILSEIQLGTRDAALATQEGSKRAASAVQLSGTAGVTIEGLALVIRDSARAAREIADHARLQSNGVEQLVVAIERLTETIQQAAEGTAAVEAGAGSLTAVARRLGDSAARFRF
jgi:methyl-accepting chemotaxis protein